MPTPPPNGELDALLTYIHERRNFDFRGYKKASLSRRVFKRMQAVEAEDYERYMEILEANPGEFAELFNTILINTTSLSRDPEAWTALKEQVLPALARQIETDEPIRVWSAGCASGEEPYTLAVLMAEMLGEEDFRRSVKIYATDADNDALTTARHGRYRTQDLIDAFGEDRTNRFFEPSDGYGVFRSDLRRALIFGRHDLLSDPPISRIDLMVCRNTLMYFTSDVQKQILTNFHFALKPGGFLFLGKSETLASRTAMFEVVDLRQHLFRKQGSPNSSGPPPPANGTATKATTLGSRSTESAFDINPIPQVVVGGRSMLLTANREARRLLSLGSSHVGRPLRQIGTSRFTDLVEPIERVLRERRPLTVHDLVWDRGAAGKETVFDVLLTPLDTDGSAVASFVDISRYYSLRNELKRSEREVETAYEELQSTVEELETTNEELQSTNEELETTNEELHSTNEELETMNEELQSTNEELETINNELRDRNIEIDDLNQFLQSILSSLKSAVIVLNNDMEVRAWNKQAEELWGLRAEEVMGQHFLNLDIGYPVADLRQPIRACLARRSEREELVEQAVNRRGKAISCTAVVSPLIARQVGIGVILMMEATAAENAEPPSSTPRKGSSD